MSGRRAAKVDLNHGAVREGLRALGWHVEDMSHVGGGVPDLYVSIGPALPFAPAKLHRGVLTEGWAGWVEVKSKGGVLTDDQQEWAWRNRGPLVVAETADEAAAAIQAMRRKGGPR